MQSTELREKNIDELHKLLLEQSTKQFKMRLAKGMGDAPKPSVMKSLRREIARINTFINQKRRQA